MAVIGNNDRFVPRRLPHPLASVLMKLLYAYLLHMLIMSQRHSNRNNPSAVHSTPQSFDSRLDFRASAMDALVLAIDAFSRLLGSSSGFTCPESDSRQCRYASH